MQTSKIKKKLQLYRTLLFLSTSTIGIASSVGITIKNNLETVVKVSEDVRDDIYIKSILNMDEYLNEYQNETNEDKFITKELLETLEELNLDLNVNDDLSILDECPNLKTLDIESAERLTNSDIKKINESQITNLMLSFDYNNVSKTREEGFDLTKFKNKNIKIKLRYTEGYSELNFLILFNYLENYNKNMFEDQETYEIYQELDNKLDEIIKEIDLKESATDIEKILLISDYICNKMTYDEDVSKYLNSVDEKEKEELKVKFAHKTLLYNHAEISSIFMNDELENKNGICINYASLFDILCYKTGVKSRLITAQSKEGLGHAWNIVYLKKEEKYVDLTFFDDDVNEFFLSCYSGDIAGLYPQEYYYEPLINTIFESTTNTHTDYILNEEIENLTKFSERAEVEYYNEQLEGTKVFNEKINLIKSLSLGIATGLNAVLFSRLISIKKTCKKEKTLEMKK